MKKMYLLLALSGLLLNLAGCSSDNIIEDHYKPEEKVGAKGTVFTSREQPETRVTVKTDLNSKFEYFWNAVYGWGHQGDKISVEISPGNLVESDFGVLKDAEGKVATFNFPGATLTENEYMVYYGSAVGVNSNREITIPSQQIPGNYMDTPLYQLLGDCGVGKATKTAEGEYAFTLHHKAAYAAVTWHCPDNATVREYQYKGVIITADEPMSGTYKLPDTEDGSLTLVSAGDNYINAETKTNSLSLPVSSTPDNADTTFLCIAPGTYHNVKVVLVVRQGWHETQWLARYYPEVTFKENELTPINIQLSVPDFSHRKNNYYQWGAKNHVWYGYENDAKFDGSVSANYPQGSGDANGRSTIFSTYPVPAGTPLATNCVNINEALWYINHGDPHWDDRPFTYMGKMYYGGVWFKKKANIPGFSSTVAPDGVDYTALPGLQYSTTMMASGIATSVTPAYTAKDLEGYYFVPNVGYFQEDGKFITPGSTIYTFNGNNTSEAAYRIYAAPVIGAFITSIYVSMRSDQVAIRTNGGMMGLINHMSGGQHWIGE